MRGSYLGPQYEQNAIELALRAAGAKFSADGRRSHHSLRRRSRSRSGPSAGSKGTRMEFGPRALGARFILAMRVHLVCKAP